MANRTWYLKENPKGVGEMCKIMKDMRSKSLKVVALRILAVGKYEREGEIVRDEIIYILWGNSAE